MAKQNAPFFLTVLPFEESGLWVLICVLLEVMNTKKMQKILQFNRFFFFFLIDIFETSLLNSILPGFKRKYLILIFYV